MLRLVEIIRRYEFLVESLLSEPPRPDEEGLKPYLDRIAKAVIERKLVETRGNVLEASKQLKIDRSGMYRRIIDLGIDRDAYNDL